jgi:uncharacterized glyoxalase superfamily protein PhnB
MANERFYHARWMEEVLREVPRQGLEAQVRRGLERMVMKMAVATRTETRSGMGPGVGAGMREGFTTVTPYLTIPNIEQFVQFAKEALGAEVMYEGRGSAGGYHFELKIGTSMLMAGGGGAYQGPWKPGALHMEVADCDAAYERAIHAGAESLYPPEDKPYGERQAGIKDPSGNMWFFGTPYPDAPKLEGTRTVTPFILRGGALAVIDFLKEAFDAREVGVVKSPDGALVHGSFWIGNALIEMGGVDFGPSAFYLYVPDADATYTQAVGAGAKSIHPPANQPYGDRMGTLEDEWGTTWYIGSHIATLSEPGR